MQLSILAETHYPHNVREHRGMKATSILLTLLNEANGLRILCVLCRMLNSGCLDTAQHPNALRCQYFVYFVERQATENISAE